MQSGIRQLFLTQKGQLSAVSPIGLVTPGIVSGSRFVIDEMPIKDDRDRDNPHLTNFLIEARSHQMTLRDLSWFLSDYIPAGGCDSQIVLEKQAPTVYGGVHNFDGDFFLGFDFEWTETGKERFCLIKLEGAFENDRALARIQSAAVFTPRDLTLPPISRPNRGENISDYRYPYFSGAEYTIGTPLCNGSEIVSRKLTLKSIGNKLDYNRTSVNWINVNLELVLNRTRNANLIEYFSKNRWSSLKLTEKNSAATSNVYNFFSNVLTLKNTFEVNKDARNIKLVFNGNVSPHDFTIDSGNNTLTVTESV